MTQKKQWAITEWFNFLFQIINPYLKGLFSHCHTKITQSISGVMTVSFIIKEATQEIIYNFVYQKSNNLINFIDFSVLYI